MTNKKPLIVLATATMRVEIVDLINSYKYSKLSYIGASELNRLLHVSLKNELT